VLLVGVTEASLADAEAYAFEQALDFPILAGASEAMDAWGVDFIWGNVVRLVDPEGAIVAVGVGDSEDALTSR